MTAVVDALAVVGQCVLAVAVTPVVIGVMRQVRARLEGRAGAGIWQPWRDLRKLMGKNPLTSSGTVLGRVGPLAYVIASVLLVALIPLTTLVPLPGVPDDLFVVVSVLLAGSVVLALLGLDAGTAFGGMGSSRHMMIGALVEPTVLLSIYALSIPVGSSTLNAIVQARLDDPRSAASPVSILALMALAIVVMAETGRLPVDNPSTHLELTMVHEAMILEVSGRDLAWIEVGSWLRLTALIGLLGNLAVPWGLSSDVDVVAVLIGALSFLAKLAVLAVVIAVVEVFLAKVRLFRVPELLGGSFVLAFLAVTASYLTA